MPAGTAGRRAPLLADLFDPGLLGGEGGLLGDAALCFAKCALMAPLSLLVGRAVQRRSALPMITGNILFGVLCGPQLAGLWGARDLELLQVVEKACLGLIALSAGAEMHLEELARFRLPILALTLSITACKWVLVYACFAAVGGGLAMLEGLDAPHRRVVGSLAATLMVARSPASAIAVLKETGGAGPFCSLSLAVVVAKDVVVIVLFALNVAVAQRVTDRTREGQTFAASGAELAFEVGVALAMGYVGKLLLQLLVSFSRKDRPHFWLVNGVVIFKVAGFVFIFTDFLAAEPLLACLATGFFVINRVFDAGARTKEELHSVCSTVMPYVCGFFSTLSGAQLHLDTIAGSFGVTFALFAARLLSLYLGAWAGCVAGRCPPEQRHVAWMAYVTQAGIAMGLAKSVALKFHDSWGGAFYNLMISVIVLNQVSGPVLFKHVIHRLGEADGGAGEKGAEKGPAKATQ